MSALLMSVTGFAQGTGNATPSIGTVQVFLDIPEIALMTAGTGNVSFVLTQTLAGEKLAATAVGDRDWIYSTVVASGNASGVSQNVGTITIAVADLHPALALSVIATIPDPAYGAVGEVGTSSMTGLQTIGPAAQTAFTAIGTHYTGAIPSMSGYQFDYTLGVLGNASYGLLNNATSNATITYTLQN